MARKILYLVRHGMTTWDTASGGGDKFASWSALPLTPKGRQIMGRTAQRLKGIHSQGIVSSDITRAKESADILGKAFNKPVQANEGLRPWNLGAFTGENEKETEPEIQHYKGVSQTPVPDGEAYGAFKNRWMQTLHQLIMHVAKTGKPLFAVTHSQNIKETLGILSGGQQSWPKDQDTKPGGIYMVEHDDQKGFSMKEM